MNLFLLITTILIWGSTWIAISLQVGDVPLIVSVFYRFAIAAALFAQAPCLFSLNFILLYDAAHCIPSGVIAIIFSLSTIYNALDA